MEHAKPQKEHAFLQKLVGEWEMVSGSQGCDAEEKESQPPGRWSETVRSLAGLWIIGEGSGDMPGGGTATTVITLGYDPDEGHYVGSWIGSMMSRQWVYKGWLEADGKTLTLEAQGPAMDGSGTMAVYHDVLILHDDNNRSFSGSVRQPDGSFKVFMTSEFRRRS